MHLSIITICFNNLQELIETCKTVDVQSTPPFEHLIIDGSSNTEIKTWLENELQPPYRKWICERDNGIADAFNKGIKNSTGEITYLLNSGDKIYDAIVLQKVNGVFSKDPSLMWCHGKLETMRGGRWVIVGKPFDKAQLYKGMRGTFHPTMYVRREVYDRHGLFDTNIKMAMDYDFLCRIADEKNTFIDYPLAIFDPAGVSSNNYLKAMKESYKSYRKYYGYTAKQTLWQWRLTFLYKLLNSKFGKMLYGIKVKMGKENW